MPLKSLDWFIPSLGRWKAQNSRDRALALGAAVGNRFLHLCRCNETYPRFGLKKKLVKPLIHILYMQTDSKFLITLRFEAGLSVINGSLNNCQWGKKAAALTCLLSWFWLMNHCVQVWFICHFSKWPLKIAENHKERKMVFMQLYSVQKVSFLFPTWKESGIRISHCTEPLVQLRVEGQQWQLGTFWTCILCKRSSWL